MTSTGARSEAPGTRAAALITLILALSAACRPEPSSIITGPEEVLVAAIVREGRVAEAGIAIDQDAPLRLPWEDGDEVTTFAFSLGDLRDPEGRPLDPAALRDGVSVAIADPDLDGEPLPLEGGCGRCLAPSVRAPHVVHSGDRCPPPPFSRAFTGGALADSGAAHVDRLRRALRIEWPGPCACPLAGPPRPRERTYRAIAPSGPDAWPHEQIAQSDDGLVGVFSERHVVLIDAREPSRRAVFQEVPGAERPRGPVRAAAALPGHGFLVQSYVAGVRLVEELVVDWFALSSSGAVERREVGAPQSFLLDSSALVGPGRSALLLAGSLKGLTNDTPVLFECALDGGAGRLACSQLTDTRFLQDLEDPPESVEGLAELGDGRVAALAEAGLVIARRETGAGWSFAAWNAGDLRVTPRDAAGERPKRVIAGAAVGSRLYLCLERSGGATLIASAEVPAGLGSGDPFPDLTLAAAAQGVRACSLAALPDAPDRVLASFGARRFEEEIGGSWIIDASGRASPADVRAETGVEGELRSARSPAPGFALLEDDAGRIHVLRRGERAARIYGPDQRDRRHGWAIAARGDELWAFGPGARATIVRAPGSGAPVEQTERTLSGLSEGQTPRVAAGDRRTGGFLLAGSAPSPWLGRLDATSLAIEAAPLPDGLGPVGTAVEASPGTFFALHGGGAISRIRDGSIERVPIAWDDPFTSAIEGAPPGGSDCQLGRLVLPDLDPSTPRALAASLGTVWIVGCKGTLLRIRAQVDPPIAERVALDGFEDRDGLPSDLTAVNAACPDQIVIGAKGDLDKTDETGRFWSIGPSLTRARIDRGDGLTGASRFSDAMNPLPANAVLDDAGTPFLLLDGGGGDLTVVFAQVDSPYGSARAVSGLEQLRFPLPFTGGAEDDRGAVLLGAPWGRLVVGELP